jgi:DNA-directed RNA polymerase specialized sigma24 family protein
VDSARARRYQKRGGGDVRITFDEGLAVAGNTSPDLVALDDALCALAKMDERRSQIIELRFFGGLTVEETAVVLKVAPDTVMRDSRLAKAWLARELAGGKTTWRWSLARFLQLRGPVDDDRQRRHRSVQCVDEEALAVG